MDASRRRSPRAVFGVLRDGAPPALPRLLDRGQEWWAARPPRQRLALALAGLLVVALQSIVGAEPARVAALVATVDLPAGHVLTAADLRSVSRPPSELPRHPADGDHAAAVGQVVDLAVPAGAVLAEAHLRRHSPRALTPDGHVALAIPTADLPPLPAGTVVDLHGGEGISVAGAVMLGTDGEVTWIGVPRDRAGALVAALAWGPVRVAVVPG